MNIRLELLDKPQWRALPETDEPLPFGQLRTNHMFLMNYRDGAWTDARIVPYGEIALMPGATCLHYGQTIFEGAKAFKHDDGGIYLFRYEKNCERLNHSARNLCMPEVPAADQMEATLRLLDIERDWCPNMPESSLYVRPFMFATQDSLGVKPSAGYIYCIMLSPAGPYYPGGFSNAVRLLITTRYHRAVSGGTGTAKCGGNYAASLQAQEYAKKLGCGQVLYLDAANRTIEEVGTMNHYHVESDGTFVIPAFNDSILKSVTSRSVLELAEMGGLPLEIKARQETIFLDKFIADVKAGKIVEAGGFGTAAVISPVGAYLLEDGTEIAIGDGRVGPHSRALYEYYANMQIGRRPAPAGWLRKVEKYG
ncbi:MAG: branched-chain amino acid aminotransferase [Planctomycetota bacterium]|jgi:branched-chain amino acid aminotransferase|nr:branched-chain amino acid aminotransferase [Planctomycetota bacterium]